MLGLTQAQIMTAVGVVAGTALFNKFIAPTIAPMLPTKGA